jgi:peptidoglycan glycosyltransferase
LTDNGHPRLYRARPVLALAAVAFAVGAVVGAQGGASAQSSLAESFARAWSRGDYVAMYADLDAASRRSISAGDFASAYQQALTTATATRVRVAGAAHEASGGVVSVPARVSTKLFGELSLDFTMKVLATGSEGARVSWSRSLVFPGLRAGEQLTRRTTLSQRAALLARDGSVLASGSGEGQSTETTRSSPLGEAANAATGTVGAIPASRRQALEAQGVPAQAVVGLSGMELALDDRLRGTPGGELLAGSRVLASAVSRPAPAVRTSISPGLQRAAVAALGGLYGGIVAMAPSTGQILAVAGIGLDGLQPPGSTFKMITLTGVLQAGLATPHTVFPYATHATLDGVQLHNANGEECGGTLENAFAVSCNSVFSPLGVKLGSARLVETAERFGFNQETGLTGAPKSTLPPASQIQGELDIGSTAIGQGRVLATPLQMATVATAIADGGRRPRPTFLAGARADFVGHATSSSVAHTVRRLMIGVVRSGTGTAAAIPGVTVAGKTGTAELKAACTPASTSSMEASAGESSNGEASKEACQGGETESSNTDAWFAAFAPALHPRVAVCVLLVKDGAGGATAAPVARQVIEAALQSGL